MCLLGPPLIFISTILLSSLFYILGPVHYLLFTFQSLTPVFWFCIFSVIKYVSSWSSTYLYIHNSLIFSLLYSRSCSLSSIHISVSDSCILVLYLLYSDSLSSVIKYVSSWSSTNTVHISVVFLFLHYISIGSHSNSFYETNLNCLLLSNYVQYSVFYTLSLCVFSIGFSYRFQHFLTYHCSHQG